jgi:L-lactate dehydrogenase complex protein LldG
MPDSSAARTAILQSIRTALGAQAAPDQTVAEYAAIPRDYKRSGSLDLGTRLDLLQNRLEEYDAGVYRTSSNQLASTIAEILAGRKKSRLAIPTGVPLSWLPEGILFEDATSFSADRLDAKVEGILTGCAVAIAETGSVVLQNATAQGPRKLSLVPDYHICIVFADQVVETVPEAFGHLRATGNLPTTFISGPSATADIEMTRIKGVHGPRFFDVILVI